MSARFFYFLFAFMKAVFVFLFCIFFFLWCVVGAGCLCVFDRSKIELDLNPL